MMRVVFLLLILPVSLFAKETELHLVFTCAVENRIHKNPDGSGGFSSLEEFSRLEIEKIKNGNLLMIGSMKSAQSSLKSVEMSKIVKLYDLLFVQGQVSTSLDPLKTISAPDLGYPAYKKISILGKNLYFLSSLTYEFEKKDPDGIYFVFQSGESLDAIIQLKEKSLENDVFFIQEKKGSSNYSYQKKIHNLNCPIENYALIKLIFHFRSKTLMSLTSEIVSLNTKDRNRSWLIQRD